MLGKEGKPALLYVQGGGYEFWVYERLPTSRNANYGEVEKTFVRLRDRQNIGGRSPEWPKKVEARCWSPDCCVCGEPRGDGFRVYRGASGGG
jgi:hypothetical protein